VALPACLVMKGGGDVLGVRVTLGAKNPAPEGYFCVLDPAT
jgi:hypothetical protein